MTVLITGAGGFIGQNVAKFLMENGIDVLAVCHKKAPELYSGRAVFCNLAKEGIEKHVDGEKIDAIIHFAGQMRGDKVRDYLDNTMGSTRKLIDYAEHAKVNQFIYISSISVYGETVSSVNEMSDRVNLDDYGMTKYLCERLLEDAQIVKRIVIRLPRTLGKGCDLSYPWLPKVTGQMLRNEKVYYMNPDLMYNNMLYVDDFSRFLLLLLERNWSGFERFVLGAQDRMSIIDILKLLKCKLLSESELIEKSASGRNKCYAIETLHAQEAGFHSMSIAEIIERFVRDVKGIEKNGDIGNDVK